MFAGARVQFSNLTHDKQYYIFIRAISGQINNSSKSPNEIEIGNFSSPFTFKTEGIFIFCVSYLIQIAIK